MKSKSLKRLFALSFALVGLPLGAAQGPAADFGRLVSEASAAAQGAPYLLEKESFIIIGNDRIAAVFTKATLEMAALVNAASGQVLALGKGPLWKISLADDKLATVQVTSAEAGERTYSLNPGETSAVLYLRWGAVSSPTEKGMIMAQARISVEAGSPHLRWKIDVDNSSLKTGLWEVDFPRLDSIAPLGDPEKNALLLPPSIGMVVANPFAQDKKYENAYPNAGRSASMQFSALYGPTNGLFFGAFDGRLFFKTFFHEFSAAARTLTYSVRQFPEGRGSKCIAYRMPYEVVTTTFTGDWFEACQIYREWVIRQVWCSKGPLQARKDVPEWFKNLRYSEVAWEQSALGEDWEKKIKPIIGSGDQTLQDMMAIAKQVGAPTMLAHFNGWHHNKFDDDLPEFFPPHIGEDAFKKQVQTYHKNGVKMIPYINGCVWYEKLPSYKELDVAKYVVRDEKGVIRVQGLVGGNSDWMCFSTRFWQDKLVEFTRRIAGDYGADGVYYDQVGGAACECFDSTHGHAVGGGNSGAEGIRTTLERCREAMKQVNPEAIMTTELLCEAYIDKLDGALLSLDQMYAGTVPAFEAVYHDYFILYGNMNLNYKEVYKGIPMSVGESFVYGDQLGWYNTWPIFTPGHPRDGLSVYWTDEAKRQQSVDFTRNMVQLRCGAGGKFLIYGQMLKPLKFMDDLPILEGWWQQEVIRRLPVVMNSVWRAGDGSLGLVFCNISDSDRKVRFKLNLKDYRMPLFKRYALIERHIDGTEKVIQTYDSMEWDLEVDVPKLNGRIFEVRGR